MTKTTYGRNLQSAFACTCSALLLSMLGSGCMTQQPGTEDDPCATGEIVGVDADANNTFTELTATQCDFVIDGDTVEIDLIDRTVEGSNLPRVLFTLDLPNGIPLGTAIDLTRADDTQPEPAIYQEYLLGTDPAEGPFWTS